MTQRGGARAAIVGFFSMAIGGSEGCPFPAVLSLSFSQGAPFPLPTVADVAVAGAVDGRTGIALRRVRRNRVARGGCWRSRRPCASRPEALHLKPAPPSPPTSRRRPPPAASAEPPSAACCARRCWCTCRRAKARGCRLGAHGCSLTQEYPAARYTARPWRGGPSGRRFLPGARPSQLR